MTTTSTICSPPLVVPQDGLSREMKLSPPPAIKLVVRGGFGSTPDVLKRKPPDIFASIEFVEVAGLLVATGSKAVPVETAHCGDHQWQGCRVAMESYLEFGLLRTLQNSTWHPSLLLH